MATMMVFVLAVIVGFALAFGGTLRSSLAVAGGAIAMWIVAACTEHFYFNQPEIFAWLLFAYVILPLVIAPLTGVLVGVLLGRPRHLVISAFAASIGCVAGMLVTSHLAHDNPTMRECLREMAAPSVLAASAAAFVTSLARRRIA